MLIAMAEDIRVIIIKLADRLHNMRTRRFWKPANTAGQSPGEHGGLCPHRASARHPGRQGELEDLSLRYLDPIAYQEIESGLALHRNEREAFIEDQRPIFVSASPS